MWPMMSDEGGGAGDGRGGVGDRRGGTGEGRGGAGEGRGGAGTLDGPGLATEVGAEEEGRLGGGEGRLEAGKGRLEAGEGRLEAGEGRLEAGEGQTGASSLLAARTHHEEGSHVHFEVEGVSSGEGHGSGAGQLTRSLSEKSPLLLSSRDMSVGVNPGLGVRHLVTFMCFLGCGISYALRGQLGVAIVAMVKDPHTVTIKNYTSDLTCEPPSKKVSLPGTEEGEFDWDSSVQGVILSAFFYGAFATQLLGGIVAERLGGRMIFGGGVFISSLFTLLGPSFARINVNLFIFARVMVGIGEGATIPAMYVILSKWSPRLERTQFGAFAMAGGNIGNVLGLSLTGVLSEDGFGGWPVPFYVFGSLGMIWVLAWVLLVYESPASHSNISVQEKVYIITTAGDRTQRPVTPWKAILLSVPVWAIVAAHFGKNWVYFTLLTSLPLYMKQVLKFDISQNGMLSSLPYLAMWLIEVVGSQLLDLLRRRKLVSTTVARKGINSIGVILTAVCLAAEGYVGCNQVSAVVLLSLAVGSLGLTSSGFQVNHLDLAPPFAGTLMGLTNNIATLPGIITPLVVSAITEGKPFVSLWQIVFLLSAGVNLLGGLLFALFASGKEQAWSHATKRSPRESDNQSKMDYHEIEETRDGPELEAERE